MCPPNILLLADGCFFSLLPLFSRAPPGPRIIFHSLECSSPLCPHRNRSTPLSLASPLLLGTTFFLPPPGRLPNLKRFKTRSISFYDSLTSFSPRLTAARPSFALFSWSPFLPHCVCLLHHNPPKPHGHLIQLRPYRQDPLNPRLVPAICFFLFVRCESETPPVWGVFPGPTAGPHFPLPRTSFRRLVDRRHRASSLLLPSGHIGISSSFFLSALTHCTAFSGPSSIRSSSQAHCPQLFLGESPFFPTCPQTVLFSVASG